MRFNGEWLSCDDGIVRPAIRGEILADDGSWKTFEFLVDTGADRTVFSAVTLAKLRLQPLTAQEGISGLGGSADSVIVETQIRLTRETSSKVVFRGQYAAVTQLDSLDIDVLGRDITGLFSAIVDQPGDVVCLLGQRHRYTIEHV
ncbi:MAG TPA: aspartyl protease family protein [Blastocatellia bacterium]|nr:aspartyl protease family protein [Blastocatellia bacterium]